MAQKGVIYNDLLGIRIEFQYNPEKIEEEKPLKWHSEDIQGMVGPLVTFQCGDLRKVRMRLLLDAFGSYHPDGHVLGDINALKALTIPYDSSGSPTSPLPQPIRGVELRGVGNPGGIPPLVKIAYGGHVYAALISNLKIEEVLHGITPQAKPRNLPVRAWVDLEFIVVDDYRMLADFSTHKPGFDDTLSLSGMTLTSRPGEMTMSLMPNMTPLSQFDASLSSVLNLGQSFGNVPPDFWNLNLGGGQ